MVRLLLACYQCASVSSLVSAWTHSCTISIYLTALCNRSTLAGFACFGQARVVATQVLCSLPGQQNKLAVAIHGDPQGPGTERRRTKRCKGWASASSQGSQPWRHTPILESPPHCPFVLIPCRQREQRLFWVA